MKELKQHLNHDMTAYLAPRHLVDRNLANKHLVDKHLPKSTFD